MLNKLNAYNFRASGSGTRFMDLGTVIYVGIEEIENKSKYEEVQILNSRGSLQI